MRAPPPTLLVAVSLCLGCGPGNPSVAPATPTQAPPAETESPQVAAGYGTLLQDQISLRLQSGQLLIKVTPLAEEIIRLTAPDTYERLRGLAEIHGPRAARNLVASRASLFLVSLFSYAPDVTYEPEDLLLVNNGLRRRPEGIAPITPSWGTQRLAQQETRMAVYAFDGAIEWETDLEVEYQGLRNEEWQDRVFPLLEAERTKVRARGGG